MSVFQPTRPEILLVALMLLICGCTRPEQAGADEAERDIAAGVLRLKSYGLPTIWSGQYKDLMNERLGIEVKWVAGCIIEDELVRNVEGYNRRMKQEIEKRFGPDVCEEIAVEAKRQFDALLRDSSLSDPSVAAALEQLTPR